MEWLRLVGGIDFNLVKRCENLVVDWPPAIVLNTLIPSFVVVTWVFVKSDVDRIFPFLFFHLVIITWSKSIDVTYGTMDKYFVINEWRKFQAT